jgi:hypothetical protein
MTLDEPRRGRRLIYPYASGPRSYVDPAGHTINFGGDTPEVYRDLYLAVSRSTLETFNVIWEAAHMIVYGPQAKTANGWTTIPPELKEPMAQAKLDAASLAHPLPLSDAFEIWERARAHLRLLAEYSPERDEILRQIAESERRVQESYAEYQRKMEERKGAA